MTTIEIIKTELMDLVKNILPIMLQTLMPMILGVAVCFCIYLFMPSGVIQERIGLFICAVALLAQFIYPFYLLNKESRLLGKSYLNNNQLTLKVLIYLMVPCSTYFITGLGAKVIFWMQPNSISNAIPLTVLCLCVLAFCLRAAALIDQRLVRKSIN